MSLYKPDPVNIQPHVRLSSWQVFLADGETMHFVGRDLAAEGRVSSRIVAFDREQMTGRTRSGRIYGLVGDPGQHPDGMYVWNHWKQINSIETAREVSLDELEELVAEQSVHGGPDPEAMSVDV